jgi:hypothetical protein
MSRKTKGLFDGEGFITHPLSMRDSIAWQHLSNNARRVLDVLEREHAHHGGVQNGKLRCTYADFQRKGGIPKMGVALAIRQAVALGFAEITFHAAPSAAEFRRCSEYRLTYIPGRRQQPPMTHEWKLVTSDAQALQRLERAAAEKSEAHRIRAREAADRKRPEERSREAA